MSQLIDANAKFLIVHENKYYHGSWDLYEQLRTDSEIAGGYEISAEKADVLYVEGVLVLDMGGDENPEIEYIHRAIIVLNKRYENGVPFGHFVTTPPPHIRSIALGIKYFEM